MVSNPKLDPIIRKAVMAPDSKNVEEITHGMFFGTPSQTEYLINSLAAIMHRRGLADHVPAMVSDNARNILMGALAATVDRVKTGDSIIAALNDLYAEDD